jgi:carbonic anhydrase
MLSCADARVPIELIFGQQANDLFVVRVAGNVLGTECLGSIDYAVSHMPTLKLLAVIGHTGCGAVTAAVEASLSPEAYMDLAANPPLRSIIDSLMAPVRLASGMLARVHGDAVPQKPGYKPALVELTIALNASMTAAVLHRTYAQQPDAALSATFAVYNIANRQAGLPLDKSADAAGWRAGLQAAPVDAQAVIRLAREMAGGRFITTLLDTAPNIPVHKESH